MNYGNASGDYRKVESVIHFLIKNYSKNPSLKQISDMAGLSESQLQRIFKRWAGITPKQFVQFIKKENILKILSDSKSLIDAALNAELSSQSRIYDLFVSYEAVTPGEYRSRGKGLTINYGIHPTIFGKCLIGISERGIVHLSFISGDEYENCMEDFKQRWVNAKIVRNQKSTHEYVNRIFNRKSEKSKKPFHLHVKGTNFQIKVWEALMKVPEGALISYHDLACCIDKPRAVRAVASAVANNPISYLIPCHRVIKKSGLIHNYRWGKERKIAMIVSDSNS